MTNRCSLFVIAAGLALAGAACDSGPAMPSAPSPVPVSNTPVSVGATVQGTVGVGNGTLAMSESVQALAGVGGAKVSVVGRLISTATDASGRFALMDVPSGQAELRFEASGVDARLNIGVVSPGQTVTLEVQVQGQSATLAKSDDRPAGTPVNFAGAVTNLSPFAVAGRTVVTDGSTQLLDRQNAPIAMSAFKVGGVVEVEGTSRADGSVLAKKIKQQDAGGNDDPAGTPVNFVGAVTSLSPFAVAGRTVVTDGSTQLLDRQNAPIAMSTFKVGGMVEVEGTSRADGSVLAKKIKQQDAGGNDDPAGTPVNFVGAVTSLSPFAVAGRTVVTDGSTQLLDRQNAPIAMSAFKVGGMVEVEGTSRADGSVLAKKIKQQDAGGNDDPAGTPVNFVGAVTSLSPFAVAGRTVVTDGSTQLLDRQNAPIAMSAFKVGGMVEVEGTSRADGSVLAKKIKMQN